MVKRYNNYCGNKYKMSIYYDHEPDNAVFISYHLYKIELLHE